MRKPIVAEDPGLNIAASRRIATLSNSNNNNSSSSSTTCKLRSSSIYPSDIRPSSHHSHSHNLILPPTSTIFSAPCPPPVTVSNNNTTTTSSHSTSKVPTVLNFEFKQSSGGISSSSTTNSTGSRSRSKAFMENTSPGPGPGESSSSSSSMSIGRGSRLEILSGSNGSLSHSKEYLGTCFKEVSKHSRKESLDSFRGINGTFSHQHQNGTFSSTSFKDPSFFPLPSSPSPSESVSVSVSGGHTGHPGTGEKGSRKSIKANKIKYPSKSIAINLNTQDGGVTGGTKKKHKSKRPLTTGNGPLSDNDNGNFAIQKITTTRIFNSNNSGGSSSNCSSVGGKSVGRNKENKENLPPIHKFLGLNQITNSGCTYLCEKEGKLGCTKCNSMVRKLKAQVEVAKTLQRQNGCLENIVTQKRNLVEQLMLQVRTLTRENQQLSKGAQKQTPFDALVGAAAEVMTSGQTTTSPGHSTNNNNISGTNNPPFSTNDEDDVNNNGNNNYESVSMNDPQVDTASFGDEARTVRSGKERSAGTASKKNPKKSESLEALEEAQQQLLSWGIKMEALQESYEVTKKENEDINRFLTNLLYTLNARGYESVTDQEGNTIDLHRCKGQSFLDLRGRDVRLRVPTKRLSPQETLLKAVIGSQERIIQSLLGQLENKSQKDSLLESCLSLENFHNLDSSRRTNFDGPPSFQPRESDVDLIARDFENPAVTKALNLASRGLLPELGGRNAHRHHTHHSHPTSRHLNTMSGGSHSPFLCPVRTNSGFGAGQSSTTHHRTTMKIKQNQHHQQQQLLQNSTTLSAHSGVNNNNNSSSSNSMTSSLMNQSVYPPDKNNLQCVSGDRCPFCSHQFSS